MDFTLIISSGKKFEHSNIIRGDKRFILKILEQSLGISNTNAQLLFSQTPLIISGKKFVIHQNFNSHPEDIEHLQSIIAVFRDLEKFQNGEYVQILHDTVIGIEKTLGRIYQNLSE